MKFQYIFTHGFCEVEIIDCGPVIRVVITDPPENDGRSVTNGIEEVATGVYRAHLRHRKPGTVLWETVDQSGEKCRVTLTFHDGSESFISPRWTYLSGGR
jgi:hypothetical protein